jgi:hypothetical protein
MLERLCKEAAIDPESWEDNAPGLQESLLVRPTPLNSVSTPWPGCASFLTVSFELLVGWTVGVWPSSLVHTER